MNFTKLDNSKLLIFCNKIINESINNSLSNVKYLSEILRDIKNRIDINLYTINNNNIRLNTVYVRISKLLADLQLNKKLKLGNI